MLPPLSETIISTTLLNLYNQCPHACRLKYIDKKRAIHINDTPLRIGKSGHLILQHFYEKIDINTADPEKDFIEKLKSSAFQYWDRSIDSRKREEVEPSFLVWLKYELERFHNCKKQGCLDRFKPIEVEQDLTDYKNRVRAVIDKRCMGISGIQYALDYKFDKKLPTLKNFKNILSEIDMKYKIQAALNSMVLKSYDHPIDSFFFQFVRFPDKLLSIPLTNILFDEVNNLIHTVRTDTEFKKNTKGCFMCNFRMYCNLNELSINCL